MKLIRQTTLRFQQGETSNKVYEVDLVETAGKYLVNFRYGRYGADLREGSKTSAPVSLNDASKIADSLLVSKINKGYWVDAGYDPVNKTTLGKQSIDSSLDTRRADVAKLSVRDQKIIDRLEQFSQGNNVFKRKAEPKIINGYHMGRTIWKAGELRIQAAIPAIKKILQADKIIKQPLDYYSILWALGRIADESALSYLDSFADKLPENTQYMLTEVRITLSSQPKQFTPAYPSGIDLAETVAKVAQHNQLEQMSFNMLSDEDIKFINRVMELQGVRAEVDAAVKQLKIEDALTDDYSRKYLPAEPAAIIWKNQAAYSELEQAIAKLLENKSNTLIRQKAEQYQPDYDLYLSLIATMDLNAVFNGDDYNAGNARNARLAWLWDGDKKALTKALKQTGEVKNVRRLWKQVEKYTDITSAATQDISDDDIRHYHQVTKAAGAYSEVLQLISQFKRGDYLWSFASQHLSLETRSKYEQGISLQLGRLFEHQFHNLQKQTLSSGQILLDTFQQTVLGIYWSSLANTQLRSQALAAISITPVHPPFTQTFRRIYKIAEFRDDAEVLGILNYRIEATAPSPSSYWDEIPKPFSKATKEYFKRRMVRTLDTIAKFQPSSYTRYATAVLLQADESDETLVVITKKTKRAYFPRLSALNFILHRHSLCFSKNNTGIWRLDEKISETGRPEAYPELWDQAEQDLLDLLLGCQAKMVNDFAFSRFSQKTVYLETLTQQAWTGLVQRPYENIALLALDYLLDSLTNLDVMQAVLASKFTSVRQKALAALDGESLAENLDLFVLMLLSEHDDVFEFASSYLHTAEAHYTDLSDRLLAALMQIDAPQPHDFARVESLLLNSLKARASLIAITPLLTRSGFEYPLLAAKLLEASDYSFSELEASYQLMSDSDYPEIRAGAIALLARLATDDKIKYKALLFKALVDKNAALRQKSREVIASIENQDLRIETFNHVLPEFFKAEPVDGFADDMLELVLILKPMYAEVDADLLWRLLNAKSKLANWVGALILPVRNVDEFSVKQLALLTKNAGVSVRDWALDVFVADSSLSHKNFSEAVRILDNRWDDSRQRAIEFFQNNFDESFWNNQRTIAICDNVYPDVQRFGRELVTRFFNADQGEEYLIKLSQHPSTNVQLFVSGFLDEYASDKPSIILSLQPYFTRVLSQVNRGRIIKDRIIHFLFNEAQKEADVAHMVAELFSDQSISMVISDKMQYIKTLFKLQTQFSHIKTPVTLIEPEVRAI